MAFYKEKGDKGSGKIGKKKPHRKVLKYNLHNITKLAICLLARRGGVKIHSCINLKSNAKRGERFPRKCGYVRGFDLHRTCLTNTVTAMDAVYAFKIQGRTLY